MKGISFYTDASNPSLIAKFVGPTWAPCWPHEPCYLGYTRTVNSNCKKENMQNFDQNETTIRETKKTSDTK